MMAHNSYQSLRSIVIASLLVLVAVGLVLWFFEGFPIENTWLGIDWHYFHSAIKDGHVNYDTGLNGLRILPWGLPFILPLGFLSFRSSWALLALITLAILVLSVPPMRHRNMRILGIFLLISCNPALRHIADGNFEGLVIAGTLFILAGFPVKNPLLLALGLLLVTTKPQTAWLFVAVTGLFLLRNWPVRRWIQVGLLVLAVVVPTTLWQGQPWLSAIARMSQRGGPEDMSLLSITGRLGVQPLFVLIWLVFFAAAVYLTFRDSRTLSRPKAAMLLAASMLLAPYTSGISYITIIAIGVIPFLDTAPRIAVLLMVLANVPYLFSPEVVQNYGNYYSVAMLSLSWGVNCWIVWRESRPAPATVSVSSVSPQAR